MSEYGDPRLPTRFWDKVHVVAEASTYPGPCWIWGASGNNDNYGQVWWEGRLQLAHRVAFRVLVADDVLHLDHLCRVTLCCNPEHLESVTAATNAQRGANSFDFRGVCSKGIHDVTDPANVGTPYGVRLCLPCYEMNRERRRTKAKERMACPHCGKQITRYNLKAHVQRKHDNLED